MQCINGPNELYANHEAICRALYNLHIFKEMSEETLKYCHINFTEIQIHTQMYTKQICIVKYF